jgi:hypothetical protein
MEVSAMPTRAEMMHSVEEYLRTRNEARMPQPIVSAIAVGLCMIFLGALMSGLFWSVSRFASYNIWILWPMGITFLGLGSALVLLGKKGTAKYRVTETTRYPQQTGEIVDMFFQILGEDYLWFVVAWLIAWMIGFSFIAWHLG